MRLITRLPRLKSFRFLLYSDDRIGSAWERRSLRGDSERSAVLFLRRMRLELKGLKRAIRQVKSLENFELVIDEDDWYVLPLEIDQVKKMEDELKQALAGRATTR